MRLILWPNIWSILENVPCVFEKNVYFFGDERIVLSLLVLDGIVLFKSYFSLLMSSYLLDIESELLKSLTIIVELVISPSNSVEFSFLYFMALFSCSYCVYNCYVFLIGQLFYVIFFASQINV